MSLHLLHAPQAVMLECKLEILTKYSSSEKPAHLNMQPHKRGQYNDVLANDTYMVAVLWNNYLHDIWLVELRLFA